VDADPFGESSAAFGRADSQDSAVTVSSDEASLVRIDKDQTGVFMYIALLILLLAAGGFSVYAGVREGKKTKTLFGIAVVAVGICAFLLMDFSGELLWFESTGYSQRFWTVVFAKAKASAAGALIGAVLLLFAIQPIFKRIKNGKYLVGAFGAAVGLLWGYSNWDVLLRYLYRLQAGTADPVFGKDIGFYLFELPLYDQLYSLLWFVSAAGLVLVLMSLFLRFDKETTQLKIPDAGKGVPVAKSYAPVYRAAGIMLIVIAWGKYLDRYHLMYSKFGAVSGAGWTDLHFRLPAYWTLATLCLILGAGFLIPPISRWLHTGMRKAKYGSGAADILAFTYPAGLIAAAWVVGLGILPAMVQWLRVEPNEITLEKPYIARNIAFTRQGFKLENVEDAQFPASKSLARQTIENNGDLLSEVRLWDSRALDAVYKQFQEIRLYYEFDDIDVDRYHFADSYRQVMISVREMNHANLPEQSRTFVNQRFKYTHGYGLTLATVSDFTPDGLPNLLIKDIPPTVQHPRLKVSRPEIYFGELTRDYVVVNTKEPEFDYPTGDENAYTRYRGSGGILLNSLWRKFLFGWKTDGTRFFLSSYPTKESRILFRRQIRQRVAATAPFLEFDEDPYPILVDGKIFWVIDAYTTSSYYPYSEPYSAEERIEYREGNSTRVLYRQPLAYLRGANYVRNSVKVIVNAYDGSMNFYVFDPDDILIQVWRRIFPDLFHSQAQMPEMHRTHVRYPHNFLLAQGLVYAKYHMEDPEVFYNQEDLWVRATEKYYTRVQPVEPYYVMWKLPGSQKMEFSLILPFTPKNRQVLIGWIAGMCDAENYGRFITYKFPKDKRMIGPQQVETKIDQDSFLSGQLSLWDQRGSRVIRGNVLAIPIDDTLLYVEPIYLQAETAAYPELRLVAVMHNDNLGYAENLQSALRELLGDKQTLPEERSDEPSANAKSSLSESIRGANRAFQNYLSYQGEGRFEEAAVEFRKLQNSLKRLMEAEASKVTDGE
jgi:uncharacterized membrane protein (UPF0182 family)